jgi:superfamily II DNA or RNA helicase
MVIMSSRSHAAGQPFLRMVKHFARSATAKREGKAMTTGIPPLRNWQTLARAELLSAWHTNPSIKALIAACPGAGKTFFTAVLIRELLIENQINLAIVLAPTVNIQLLWVEELEGIGLKATEEASNFSLRWRKEANVSMTEDNQIIVLTYAQLARDERLIAEMARRAGKTLTIGDEIHHADDDEKFGSAVQILADASARTLALSGTPFNSTGGALALCEHETDIDHTGKPIRRTLATYTYSYGDAIQHFVCRPAEFIKVYGRGEATYRLISDKSLFKRITDLAAQRKADRIAALLDPEGEFMEECARQAVRELARFRAAGDKKSAMLVVARNKAHGAQMARLLARTCEAEKQRFLIQEIYNDTPKAHERITNLVTDLTDIIVSVRMISEGVDIKRLRVGLFATDWMTRMFFIQFAGRFVRHEDRLDKYTQFAKIIVPAHRQLLEYIREIEIMIESAAILEPGEGSGPIEKKSEFIEVNTEATSVGLIYRSQETERLDLAESFFSAAPSAKGRIPSALAIDIAKELGLDGASPDKPSKQRIDWGNLNDLMVRAVVKRLKENGQSDEELYARVQGQANHAVGIKKKDALTAEDTLIRRHTFLQAWLKRLMFKSDNA